MIGKIFRHQQRLRSGEGQGCQRPLPGANNPSLGACRPDIRENNSKKGDHIFVVSGKVPNVDQFVIGGFEIEEKIGDLEAFERFPEQRLSWARWPGQRKRHRRCRR